MLAQQDWILRRLIRDKNRINGPGPTWGQSAKARVEWVKLSSSAYQSSTWRICDPAQQETGPDHHLVQLINGTDERFKEFQNMIRTYDNHFAFTTIGITCDDKYQQRDHGIYTVKVQGQIHHYPNDLIPQDASKKMTGIQFYFFDPDHQVSNRLAAIPRLDASIVEKLVELLE
ncbi:hypothetical protein LIER_40405 [Lithospermum erythrorhizon]|uniref:Uncharacterized protein n=1 Tax=Lithospermum erythrorhizon TaxID=34254 RepID=A0AAV3QWI8_LITER